MPTFRQWVTSANRLWTLYRLYRAIAWLFLTAVTSSLLIALVERIRTAPAEAKVLLIIGIASLSILLVLAAAPFIAALYFWMLSKLRMHGSKVLFFQDLPEMSTFTGGGIETELRTVEEAWVCGYSVTHITDHDLFKMRKIKKLIVIDPEGKFLPLFAASTRRTSASIKSTLETTLADAKKWGASVSVFDGPLPVMILADPDDERGWVRFDLVFPLSMERPGVKFTKADYPKAFKLARTVFEDIDKNSRTLDSSPLKRETSDPSATVSNEPTTPKPFFCLDLCWDIMPSFYEQYTWNESPSDGVLDQVIKGPFCKKCGRPLRRSTGTDGYVLEDPCLGQFPDNTCNQRISANVAPELMTKPIPEQARWFRGMTQEVYRRARQIARSGDLFPVGSCGRGAPPTA